MNQLLPINPHKYRSIWISDVHLGTKDCKAEFLLNFLKSTECDYLFLVGDIIDVWNMRSGVYWPQSHNNVIRTILSKAKNGTKIIYIPGNHDEIFREHCGSVFGNVEIHEKYIHETKDGRRLLILHGDEFDSVVTCSKFIALLGSKAYDYLLRCNRWINWIRKHFGKPYWSLAAYLKHKVKNAVNYISDFEEVIAYAAKKENVDGLVCGHIHHAEIRDINGVLYCNDGDWVESCTAMIERADGSLSILYWTEEQTLLKCESEISLDVA